MKLTDKELMRRIRITKPYTTKRLFYSLIYSTFRYFNKGINYGN